VCVCVCVCVVDPTECTSSPTRPTGARVFTSQVKGGGDSYFRFNKKEERGSEVNPMV